MKITFKGDYALKTILDLALTYGQPISQIKDIAKRQDIPEKYLEQIIVLLKGASYVKTVRGPKGGVFLAKPPSKITLGEIIRLVEGPTSPITCVSTTGYVHCSFENRCAFRGVFLDIKNRINDVVDNTTFEDMVNKTRKMQGQEVIDFSI
jgi:Rrf2 family protein